MTVRELDRLVTRTEITPLAKTALRGVRRAIQTGRCGDAQVGRAEWSVAMDSVSGYPLRIHFSFRRDSN